MSRQPEEVHVLLLGETQVSPGQIPLTLPDYTVVTEYRSLIVLSSLPLALRPSDPQWHVLHEPVNSQHHFSTNVIFRISPSGWNCMITPLQNL